MKAIELLNQRKEEIQKTLNRLNEALNDNIRNIRDQYMQLTTINHELAHLEDIGNLRYLDNKLSLITKIINSPPENNPHSMRDMIDVTPHTEYPPNVMVKGSKKKSKPGYNPDFNNEDEDFIGEDDEPEY